MVPDKGGRGTRERGQKKGEGDQKKKGKAEKERIKKEGGVKKKKCVSPKCRVRFFLKFLEEGEEKGEG